MIEIIRAAFPVLVCGGRTYANREKVAFVLGSLHVRRKIDILMTGAQRKFDMDRKLFVGADHLALEWARENCVPYIGVPADWGAYGKKAGPIRNSDMLDIMKPKCLVAFPGGRGTADMVKKVRHRCGAGCYVMEIEE